MEVAFRQAIEELLPVVSLALNCDEPIPDVESRAIKELIEKRSAEPPIAEIIVTAVFLALSPKKQEMEEFSCVVAIATNFNRRYPQYSMYKVINFLSTALCSYGPSPG